MKMKVILDHFPMHDQFKKTI